MSQETRGKPENLKGREKETLGVLPGTRTLEQEGARQRAEGAAKERPGEVVEKIGKPIKVN